MFILINPGVVLFIDNSASGGLVKETDRVVNGVRSWMNVMKGVPLRSILLTFYLKIKE